MNADAADWTADLLAVWYWDAYFAGKVVRLAFELAYAPPRPPDRIPKSAPVNTLKFTPKPQHIAICDHPKTLVNTKGAWICEQCLTVVGLLAPI